MNIKTILLGDRCVGKTQFLNHLRTNPGDNYCPTIGVDFVVYKGPRGVNLQIWDTSGSARFKHIVNTFLKGIDLCIFVYRSRRSFEIMMSLMADVQAGKYGKRFCIIAFDNAELGQTVASKFGYFFFQVNVYNKEACVSTLAKISRLCEAEQKRCNFLELKNDETFSIEKERESGYCWYSFC